MVKNDHFGCNRSTEKHRVLTNIVMHDIFRLYIVLPFNFIILFYALTKFTESPPYHNSNSKQGLVYQGHTVSATITTATITATSIAAITATTVITAATTADTTAPIFRLAHMQ